MSETYQFEAGPLDGARLSPHGSPSVVRVQDPPGSYAQDLRSGTYRWFPHPAQVDALSCETVVDAAELVGLTRAHEDGG